MTRLSICLGCKNFIGKKDNKYICKAFESIPMKILLGKNEHKEPLKDQENKIVFEEKK